jgi:hypothetical protein
VELAGLIALAGLLDVAAGTGLAYVAGFGATRSVLSHPDWSWLAAMAGALCVSFAGYFGAYRGVYGAEDGFRLSWRRLFAVVTAGFGGFFAHWGTTPDDLVLQRAGASHREAMVRALALGGVEQGTLAAAGCAASVIVLCRGQAVPLDVTLPWALVPVPAAILAWQAAVRFSPRLRERGRCGGRASGRWRDRLAMFLDSVLLIRQIVARPLRHWLALGGMIVFWAAEIFAVWAGLAAFGAATDGAALTAGFCTGMVFTRRVAPLAGAGTLTLALPLAIWYCGFPLPVAVAGTFAYRAFTLWLPMPFALATLPVLRQISKDSLPFAGAAGGSPRRGLPRWLLAIGDQAPAQIGERPSEQPGDVHLGDAEAISDLALREVAVEAHHEDALLAHGQFVDVSVDRLDVDRVVDRLVVLAQHVREQRGLVAVGERRVQRVGAEDQVGLAGILHFFFGDAQPLGQLAVVGRPAELLGKLLVRAADGEQQFLRLPADAHVPPLVAEVPLDLTAHARLGVGRQPVAERGIEVVDGLEQAYVADLHQVLRGLGAVTVPADAGPDQPGVAVDEYLADDVALRSVRR